MQSRCHRLALWFAAACVAASAAHGAALERGTAIADPLALRELDLREQPAAGRDGGYSLPRMLGASGSLSSADIFALPSMRPLRDALDREFGLYDARDTKLQLFDREALFAATTRFVLAGIVNRMDRAYKSPAACGEIRLIYRPIANDGRVAENGATTSSRLPMTLNVVLDARNDKDAISCAEIARRWLTVGDTTEAGADLAVKLISKGGILDLVTPDHIDRIETNIQIARASDNPDDFESRADYLLKVFKYDRSLKSFVEGPMENQIDRERLMADASLATDFTQWLFAPENFGAFDRGTILLPEKFLATRAIVTVPVSAAVDSAAQAIVRVSEIVAALAKMSASATELENIKSPDGFARRLDDITCSGCHQTRAIGGFHFPGADRAATTTAAVIAPASPHFFGDQPRRRDILTAFRDGKMPDFSRGFSARPQARRAMDLDGTTYLNGWGAHCYVPSASAPKPDKSFASWTCIAGLACQMPAVIAGSSSAPPTRAGLCFPGN